MAAVAATTAVVVKKVRREVSTLFSVVSVGTAVLGL